MLSPVYGKNNDVVACFSEIHGVRKPVQDRTPRFCSHASKLHRIVGDGCDRFVSRCAELDAKPGAPTVVPVSRFECFRFSLRPKTDTAIHSRSISLRRTSSQGIEDSGR
jgi:hypothetical protein